MTKDFRQPPTLDEILAEPSSSHWLKDALREAMSRDPVDASRDADLLSLVLAARADAFLAIEEARGTRRPEAKCPMATDARQAPNPQSKILAGAVVGGAGFGVPKDIRVPRGMAALVLLFPAAQIQGKSVADLQRDLGLPWGDEEGMPFWYDDPAGTR